MYGMSCRIVKIFLILFSIGILSACNASVGVNGADFLESGLATDDYASDGAVEVDVDTDDVVNDVTIDGVNGATSEGDELDDSEYYINPNDPVVSIPVTLPKEDEDCDPDVDGEYQTVSLSLDLEEGEGTEMNFLTTSRRMPNFTVNSFTTSDEIRSVVSRLTASGDEEDDEDASDDVDVIRCEITSEGNYTWQRVAISDLEDISQF